MPSIAYNFKTYLTQLVVFLSSLAGTLLVVFVLGLFMHEGMISHAGDYFGKLSDIFSIALYMPVLLIVFGIIAFFRKDWTFITYPLIVFYVVGPLIDKTYIANALDESLGINFSAALIGYGLLHAFVYPTLRLARIGKFKHIFLTRAMQGAFVSIYALLALVIYLSPIVAAKVTAVTYANLLAIRLVAMNDMVAVPEGSADGISGGLTLHYGKTLDNTGNEVHPSLPSDRATYSSIQKHKPKNPRQVCGARAWEYSGGPITSVQYHKTTSGLEYGTYTFEHVYQKNADGTMLTKPRYNSCFVLDGKKYEISQEAITHESIPSEKLIEAFMLTAPSKFCTETNRYCSETEYEQTSQRLASQQIKLSALRGSDQ